MSLVLEPGSIKKIKIILEDYPYLEDIHHRVLFNSATATDIKVLEEILFSPIKTTLKKLEKQTDLDEVALKNSLKLWMSTKLVKEEEDSLLVDKELRKYFELEIQRFEADFEPGIDFFGQLLKKVPIHALPIWYALPRTSTHIFDSIIEKYLHTPQIYQRYLSEVQTSDPVIKTVIDLLFTSDHLELSTHYLKTHLNLTDEALYQLIAVLEFSLIGCVKYKSTGETYQSYFVPYAEFREYLTHLRATECQTLNPSDIQNITLSPFGFVEGLIALLKVFKQKPSSFPLDSETELLIKETLVEADLAYLDYEELFQKLHQTHLIEIKQSQVVLNETSMSFMAMKPESAALVLYRHPLNKPIFDLHVPVDKAIRECEKAATRLVGKNWVLFEEFMKSILISLSEEQHVILKKVGRRWRYVLPTYTDYEKDFMTYIFLDWFEKVGVTEKGFYTHRPCLRLTPLGTEIFS